MTNRTDKWKTDLLICPKNGGQLTGVWPLMKNRDGIPLEIDDYGIVKTDVSGGEDLQFHLRMDRGAVLRKLQYKHLHLCYWETSYYKETLVAFLEGVDPRGKTAMDVGCGDGRFTEQLIRLGYERVVATDIDIRPLQGLAMYSEAKGFRDKLLLIQCSADCIPVKQESVDVALSIGVLYYLNERFEDGLRCIVGLLRPSGILIDSEPDFEGALLKAMIFEDLTDYVEVFQGHTFTEACKGEKSRFRVFTADELQGHYRAAGLDVLDRHGLSLFPSILRIAMVRGKFTESEIADIEIDIRKTFDYFDQKGSVYKHIIWKTKKK